MAVCHNLKIKLRLSVAGLYDFNRITSRTVLPIASSMLTNFTTSYLSAFHPLQSTWFHFLNLWLNLYGCLHYTHLPVIHNELPEEENFHSVWHNFYCCIKIYRIKKTTCFGLFTYSHFQVWPRIIYKETSCITHTAYGTLRPQTYVDMR